MCQNTPLNWHYIKLLNSFCGYPWQSLQNASNGTPEATFAHVHSRSPDSLKWASWDHLWPRCLSKDCAFGVHRWDHFLWFFPKCASAQRGSDIAMVKDPVKKGPPWRGGWRERLVYVFRTFSKKSCNSTALRRSDPQKHVVKLTFFSKMCQNTS